MDFEEKAFASATETSKLIITLSTGVIAFCAAVVNVKDADKTLFTPIGNFQKGMLAASWSFFLLSIAMGIVTQLAITSVLALGANGDNVDVNAKKITTWFGIQLIFFVVGVLALVLYCSLRLFS